MNSSTRIAWIAAGVTLLVHLVANPHYGFFRDELYFIICGRHPALGYVDQPPLVPLISAGSQLFGTSLFLLRATCALFAAAGVFVTCRFVQELRGGAFAQILAAIVVATTPVLTNFGAKVGPDMVGLWLWPLAALYVARMINGADKRWWLGVGLVLGISCLGKYSVVLFAIALVLGLALSPQRRVLATPWTLAGLGLCVLIVLPNFLWQAGYGFPMLELLRNGQNGKNIILGPGEYLVQEILITNLLLAPVWIIGVVWSFTVARTRWIGWTYVLLIAMMIALHGKHYYPADIYPLVIAAGATAIEGWTRGIRFAQVAVLTCAIIFSLWMLPRELPILSEPQIAAYNTKLAAMLHMNTATEHHKETAIGSDFADMHGWPELTATVASIYASLSPADREKAAIAASNYGEAAAIDFYGAQYGLPPVISHHNQYWLWGTHGYTGDVLIDVNGDCGKSIHLYRNAKLAATFTAPYVQPYEDNLPISLCRGITRPLTDIWPEIKDYE